MSKVEQSVVSSDGGSGYQWVRMSCGQNITIFSKFKVCKLADYEISNDRSYKEQVACDNGPNDASEYNRLLKRRISKINKIVENKNEKISSYEERIQELGKQLPDLNISEEAGHPMGEGSDLAVSFDKVIETFNDYFELTKNNLADWCELFEEKTFYRYEPSRDSSPLKSKFKKFEESFEELEEKIVSLSRNGPEAEEEVGPVYLAGPMRGNRIPNKSGNSAATETNSSIENKLKGFLHQYPESIESLEKHYGPQYRNDPEHIERERTTHLSLIQQNQVRRSGSRYLQVNAVKTERLKAALLHNLLQDSIMFIVSGVVEKANKHNRDLIDNNLKIPTEFDLEEVGDCSQQDLKDLSLLLNLKLYDQIKKKILEKKNDVIFDDIIDEMSENICNVISGAADCIVKNPQLFLYNNIHGLNKQLIYLYIQHFADSETNNKQDRTEFVKKIKEDCIEWLTEGGKDHRREKLTFTDDTFDEVKSEDDKFDYQMLF
ncbi:hypothetical protein [Roseibium aggregatum]|nr:hypothetical protein [Roseibium aggregatum]